MQNSSLESQANASVLRAYLASVLPDSRLTDAAVDAAYQPLLLMQTKHVMAAFAFSNGEMRKSYEDLYRSFKNYYAEQRGMWDALDLAFVFCVQPGVPNLDRFCSNVETDVYFCRKFVVPLILPLDTTLARLPFLPLTPLDGQSQRPPSAQTFLQQCRVPAILAKFLVVQHQRSPEGIVEDCTSGEFGEPQELTPIANAPGLQADQAVNPVRLETVSIENFRAYRKTQTFLVGKDVTVLYGPNGFGKTSFFDAVDFAATGGIGRIRQIESSSDATFKRAAQHLDSKLEDSLVTLSFLCNGTIRKITRSVRDRKQALLDGRSTDRKAILGELTGGDIPATDRVENFVSLFRATHLFSQEHQELTKDFQDDCQLSGQIVSRMLAFEDFANAVNKAAKVRTVVQSAIANASQEIKELSEQIADEKKELDRLGQTAKAHSNIEALDADIAALRSKLASAGIAVVSDKSDVATVRGWRASLEARYAESQSRSTRLSDLAKEVAGLPRIRTDLAALQQQIAQTEQAVEAADEKRVASELLLQMAEQRVADIAAKRTEAQARAGLLEWVRMTQPGYAQLLDKQRVLNEELNRATIALAQHQASEEKATTDLHTMENLAEQVRDKLTTNRAELVAVQTLIESLAAWQTNRTRLGAVDESEKTALISLEALRADERDKSSQVAALATEEARLARQVAEVDQSQSELKTLLSQLQGHVRNGTCPLCGEDHGSKDALISRIQKHVVADIARATRAELNGVRGKSRQLAEWLASNKQGQQTTDAHLVNLKNERAKLITEIGIFANSVAKVGIVIDSSGPTPAEQLQDRHDRLQQEIANLNRQIQETGAALQAARVLRAEAKNLVTAKATVITDAKATLMRLQEETNKLRNDPRLTDISLDIDPEQLAEIERDNLVHLTNIDAEAAISLPEAAQAKAQVSTLRQGLTSLKAQLAPLRTHLLRLQSTVTQITGRLKDSKLSPDTAEDTMLAMIAEQSRMQAQLLALRDSSSNMELAIDAATTAAALTRLLENIRNKEKAVTTAVRKRDQYQPWLKYFDELARLVSSQQNDAIADFAREYGPRTSVIQRRLRAVYGFDDIEIRSRESAITVRVKRNGEELRPTDYFSQSQQQTLLLGLFLTACSSQNWSAFSPVFLDDPVTHFDDLNTYAFLDLIVGLLESNIGTRQFIISTCDEKLLQLAQQKFRHLDDRAKFYRFSAIGAEGPVVAEIAPT